MKGFDLDDYSFENGSIRELIDLTKKSLIKKDKIKISIGGENIEASREDIYAIQYLVAIGELNPCNIKGIDIKEDGTLKHPVLTSIGDVVSMKLLKLKCK